MSDLQGGVACGRSQSAVQGVVCTRPACARIMYIDFKYPTLIESVPKRGVQP
jgi:hypothetical protein